jgi:hypothetical protein
MKPAYEVAALWAAGGTVIASGGTVTGTGVEWSPTYEPEGALVVTSGATPSGTLIYRFCGGTALADVANVFAVGTLLPAVGGTVVATAAGAVTTRYANVQLIATGGTSLASANFVAKPRTVT